MSVLTKKEILEALETDKLKFDPPIDKFQLQPHAVDLRLGFNFFIPIKWELNEKGRCAMNIDYLENNKKTFDEITLKQGQFFEILPQETIIAQTLEHISINNSQLMAIIYPRSSLNRRGLAVDLTGIVDTMYTGHLIIPIKNNTNQVLRLYPGERFCSLVFETLKSAVPIETARLHGVNLAKYSKNGHTNYKVDYSETDFIKTGDINGLKQNYKLN